MVLKLEIKKEDPRTLILYWDEEIWRKVCKSLFINELIKFPRDLQWEDFYSRFTLVEEKISKRYAVFLLAKRNLLSSELEAKLLVKGFSSNSIKAAILYCVEKGYLDDAQEVSRLFAKEIRKGHSSKAAYFKLKQKKIDDSQLRHHLEQAALIDKQNLKKWLIKHASKVKRDDPKEMKKLAAKLCRRGFSMELVLQELSSSDIKFTHSL